MSQPRGQKAVLEMVLESVPDRQDKNWGALVYGEEPWQPFLYYQMCGSRNSCVLRAWLHESFFFLYIYLPVAKEEEEEDFCLFGGSALKQTHRDYAHKKRLF